MLPLAPFKTNTLLPALTPEPEAGLLLQRSSIGAEDARDPCMLAPAATLLTLALHMQQDRRLHRRAAVWSCCDPPPMEVERGSESSSPPLFAHCIDAMQKPAAEPGTAAACIYTYIRLLDGCSALCALYRKAAPSGEFIHIRHGRLSGRQIYI